MSHYDLSHLVQDERQAVMGPIQDDEALFLYALVRGMRLKTVFEVGGQTGYSALNFLRAVGSDGRVYTCDVNPVPRLAKNHVCILKNALDIAPADLEHQFIDLVFFDCHDEEVQMAVFHRLSALKLIDDSTVFALHDTCLHPIRLSESDYWVEGGCVHQAAERRMVNAFVGLGYHAFSLHTRPDRHSDKFPFRHGVTVVSRYKYLQT